VRVLSLALCANWLYLNDCLDPGNICKCREMIAFDQYLNACVLNKVGNTIYYIYVWSGIKLEGAF
jgi:hypothetical protein